MATKYAINTGALTWTGSCWNTASNQATSNTTAPTSSDTAVLDRYSSNMTVNTTSSTCQILTMTGYTNTLTFGAGNTLLVKAGTSTLGGTLAGTGTLNIAGTTLNGTSLGVTTIALYIAGNSTVNTNGTTWGSFSIGTSYTCTLGSNLQIAGDFTVRTNTAGVMAGAYDITADSLTIQNKCTLTLVINQNLTVNKIYISGVQGYTTTLKSSSASTNTNIVFNGTEDQSIMYGATLTDINFTGTRKMYTWFGSVVRGANSSVVNLSNLATTNLLLK